MRRRLLRGGGLVEKVPPPREAGWRALSFRQPWLWLVVRRLKPVENRPRNIGIPPGGAFVLHASARSTREDEQAALGLASRILGEDRAAKELDAWRRLDLRGGFCGAARALARIAPGDPRTTHGNRETFFYEQVPGRDVEQVVGGGSAWDLRWWMREQHGYLLADVAALPFVPGPGMLGFFRVPPDVVEKLGLPPSPEQWDPSP